LKDVTLLTKKERLDVLLVEQGLCSSREKAKKMIMAGLVFVDGQREDKAGTMIDRSLPILMKEDPNPYVSRGGLKLHKAIKQFGIHLEGAMCIDVGASTGGFTDCMLQHGAIKVYSVDVGYGQFDWALRQDPRVVCLEKTNIRYITKEQVPDLLDFASIDVSFISLSKVLSPVVGLLKPSATIMCLIKPQFEAGKDKIGKKGVVKDPEVHAEVIKRIIDLFTLEKLNVTHLDFSPITGPEGNIEYLIYGIKKEGETIGQMDQGMNLKVIDDLVNNAHRQLYGK
jgi:23S rRNA (cytidine1920-2'-O)/16S rRNA (cytidine1409-2'-O)-methyltransferase